MRFALLLLLAVGCATAGPAIERRPRPANARQLCDARASAQIAWLEATKDRVEVTIDEQGAARIEVREGLAHADEHHVLRAADGRRVVLAAPEHFGGEARAHLGISGPPSVTESLVFAVDMRSRETHYLGYGSLWSAGDARYLLEATGPDGVHGLFDLPADAHALRRQSTLVEAIGDSSGTVVLAKREGHELRIECLGTPGHRR